MNKRKYVLSITEIHSLKAKGTYTGYLVVNIVQYKVFIYKILQVSEILCENNTFHCIDMILKWFT